MLVSSYGFSIKEENSKVSLNDLFNSLVSTSGHEDTSKSNVRRIFVDTSTNKNFVLGLVVTVKNQKTFCQLVNNKGNFVISVNNLRGENRLMEFNFFVINKNNGLGIYQHYHHSCSPETFGNYLRVRYRNLAETLRDREIADLKTKDQHTLKKEKAIKKAHGKGLSFSLLVHKDSLKSVLAQFKEIKAFDYEFTEIKPDYMDGAPISNFVRRLRQKASFKPNIGIDILSQAIQSTVNKIRPKSGRVSVIKQIDDEDIPMSVKIWDIPEHFGEQEYDAVAGKLDNLDTSKFASHKVANELLNACTHTYKHIFMRQLKD